MRLPKICKCAQNIQLYLSNFVPNIEIKWFDIFSFNLVFSNMLLHLLRIIHFVSEFDNYYKIAIRDHVRVPKFLRTWIFTYSILIIFVIFTFLPIFKKN